MSTTSEKISKNYGLRIKSSIGQGIRIALVDSGIDGNHPKLKNPIIKKINAENAIWDDLAGHGTMMAGVISKIAPKAELLDARITSRDGLCYASDVLSVLESIYLSDFSYLDIMVFGVASPIPSNGSDVLSVICKKFVENGTLLVFPAGNFGPEINTIGFPEHIPNSFCIGSVNSSGRISFFSSRSSKKPDYYVVGENVTTLKSFHGILGAPLPTGETIVSGTSISCAKFAGILALVKQAFPEFNYKELDEFFTRLSPSSKLISEKTVIEKVNEIQPLIFPFKRAVMFTSLITVVLGVLGIASIFLAR
jgi:serine protease AprX